MAAATRQRMGEIQRAVFGVLVDHPDGLPVREVIAQVERVLPPTPSEAAELPGRGGLRRFDRLARFGTITSVKAGWLVKDGGTWRLTEDGRRAYEEIADPEQFERRAIELYNAWKRSQPDDEDPDAQPELPGGERGQAGWLVRGSNVHGHNYIREWLGEGYCSVAAPELREVAAGTPRADIAASVAEDYPELSASARGGIVSTVDTFLNQVQVGDLVVTVDGQSVFVGEVQTGPRYEPTTGGLTSRRRDVRWVNADRPLQRQDLPSPARAKLTTQRTVASLGPHTAVFAGLLGLGEGDAELDDLLEPLRLTRPTAELADALLVDRAWLDEVVDLLEDRRQLVFYGPPGTGKTYLAQGIAAHLAGEDGYRLVQFHPSYSYEDFFEGFRPRQGPDGTVGLELVRGPLRRLAAEAADNPTQTFVLIIDEINRANLAKVFGELYFLLEYRDRAIALLYSPDEDFTLPPNLYLIGTMNTADRSIALVDAAMRRRFAFVPLHPDESPTREILGHWLRREGYGDRSARLLAELNRRLDDRDFKVGPSYVMRQSAQDERGLERVWRTSVLPLLEEHHYGDGVDVEARYGLAALQRAVSTTRAPEDGAAGDDAGETS